MEVSNPQAAAVANEIAHLRGLDFAGLRARWRSLTGRAAPAPVARTLLLQVLAYGLRPGTVLVRAWDDRSERVMVLADGFAWNGTPYKSLSQVARAITGTRWNGPRFFGLRDKKEAR